MKKKSEVVVKSNRLVEASYRLTLNESRIILYAICRCREEQKGLFPDQPLTITAEAFLKQFPKMDKDGVYRQLKEAMNSLYTRSVTIRDIDPETRKLRVKETRWISEKAYIDGAGHIQIIFTPEVIKHITRLDKDQYTIYQLERVGNMTSAHAVRLYELLSQYREAGKRTISLAWLRDALKIAPDEYKLTANFIRKVIDVAVKQIKEHSDLEVKYDALKTGRAITDFAFKIKVKDAKPKRAAPTDHDLRQKLEAHGQQRIDDPVEEF